MTDRRHYFAFGSNMSRARLQARIGDVEVVGRVVLSGWVHGFDKLGSDGTAKGNIVMLDGGVVHGVLYRVTLEQLLALERFEGGYRRATLSVSDHAGRAVEAETFLAREPGCSVPPSEQYLRHYARGLREHGIDRAYAEAIARTLPGPLAEIFLRATYDEC